MLGRLVFFLISPAENLAVVGDDPVDEPELLGLFGEENILVIVIEEFSLRFFARHIRLFCDDFAEPIGVERHLHDMLAKVGIRS